MRAHMLENSSLHALDKGIKLSYDLLYQSPLMVYDWNISVWCLKYLCSLPKMKNLFYEKKLKKMTRGMFDRLNGKIVFKLCKMFWNDI